MVIETASSTTWIINDPEVEGPAGSITVRDPRSNREAIMAESSLSSSPSPPSSSRRKEEFPNLVIECLSLISSREVEFDNKSTTGAPSLALMLYSGTLELDSGSPPPIAEVKVFATLVEGGVAVGFLKINRAVLPKVEGEEPMIENGIHS